VRQKNKKKETLPHYRRVGCGDHRLWQMMSHPTWSDLMMTVAQSTSLASVATLGRGRVGCKARLPNRSCPGRCQIRAVGGDGGGDGDDSPSVRPPESSCSNHPDYELDCVQKVFESVCKTSSTNTNR